jgi:hypothetical protein
MPNETVTPPVTSVQVGDIPLHLVPKTIAEQIKGKREPVFRITAEKTFHNRFTVIVETYEEYTERLLQESTARKEGDGHG